jgi:hypothetical protein
LDAVRGLSATPSVAEAADSSAIASEIASGTSSSLAGSIRCGVSNSGILADLRIDQATEYKRELQKYQDNWPLFWPIFHRR